MITVTLVLLIMMMMTMTGVDDDADDKAGYDKDDLNIDTDDNYISGVDDNDRDLCWLW